MKTSIKIKCAKYQLDNFFLIPELLANEIGCEESVVLTRIQYWIQSCGKSLNNEKGLWIYNSLQAWSKQFTCFTLYKLKKIIASLENRELLISKKVNAKKCNHTKWYTINFAKLNSIVTSKNTAKKFRVKPTDRSVENQPIYNIQRNNYTKISSYKKQISSKMAKAIKEESFKNEILEEEKLLAEKMKETWNIVFQCSPKPIKAYINKSLIPKLCKLYQEKFNGNIQEWELYAKKINSSKFLMGEKETKTNFKAVFSWLIKEETVDAILGGAYGVGDRTLDLDNLDHNLKIQETEVTTIANEKVSQYLDQMVDEAKEENEFKEYVLKMKYQEDSDRYQVRKHMEEVGKHYMYGGYITPSHVYYPDKVVYRKRLYKSYLMAKYLGVDEISLSKGIKSVLHTETNKIKLFQIMASIKERIRNVSFVGGNSRFDIAAITALDSNFPRATAIG